MLVLEFDDGNRDSEEMGQISRFSNGKYSIQLAAKIHPLRPNTKYAFIRRCTNGVRTS